MKRKALAPADPFGLGQQRTRSGHREDTRPKIKFLPDRKDPTHIIIGNIKAFNKLDPDPLGPKLRERMTRMNLQVNLLIFFFKGPGYRDFSLGLTKETDAAWVRLMQIRYPKIKVEYLKSAPMPAPALARYPKTKTKKQFDTKAFRKKARERKAA